MFTVNHIMLGEASRNTLDQVVIQKSAQYGIDPNLVRAIITQESNWNPNAKRFEPSLNESSSGLMQPLLSTARWISGNSNLTDSQLMDPTTNIDVGTRYLQYLFNKYGNIEDVIASYNAGSPRRGNDGAYTNQAYVDKVSNYLSLYASVGTTVAPILASVYSTFTGGSQATQANANDAITIGSFSLHPLFIMTGAILVLDMFNVMKKTKRKR